MRVAVFGTGRAGGEVVRACCASDAVEVAAGVVVNVEKHGRDLGELTGIGRLGVDATVDFEGVIGRPDVDVVLYCGLGGPARVADIFEQCADAGKDAITITGLVHPPTALGRERAQALAARAEAHKVRLVGTGLNPGFLLDVLPVVWSSCSVDFQRLHARRVGDMRTWGRGIQDECGLGLPPDRIRPGDAPLSLAESLALIGEGLGIEFEHIEHSHEPYVSSTRREHDGRVIEAGQTAGFRQRAVGFLRERVVEIEWIVVFCLDPELDGLEEGATLRIEGRTTIEARTSGSFFADPYPAAAARAVNSVLPLRRLRPGLYRPDQLPFGR